MRDEKAYYQANREHKLILAKKRYQEKGDEIRAYQKIYHADPEYKLKKRLKRYGLSRQEYTLLLERQKGRCAICRGVFEKEPHIDHNHNTNKVRGLLCGHCNAILGYARDNPDILNQAREYLKSANVTD